MHSTVVNIPADQQVRFHCEHDDGWLSLRLEDGSEAYCPTYVNAQNVTGIVELGERLIQAAIGHAAPDRSEAVLWRDYLAVRLERAEKAVRDERSIDVELWSA